MKILKTVLAHIFIILILSGCVQQTHLKTVTFKLDMSGVKNPAKVGIRGSFTDNPWKETIFFQDTDNDGIYEGIISQKTAANGMQFKFVNNNSDYELQNQGNRFLKFEYKPETIIYSTKFNDTTATIKKQ